MLLYLTGIQAQDFEAGNGAIPTRGTVRQMVRDRLREGTLAHLRFTLAEQSLRIAALTPPAFPYYGLLEERVWPHLQSGYLGEKEPVAALEAAYRAAEELVPPAE